MAVKVWDRDEYLAMKRAEARAKPSVPPVSTAASGGGGSANGGILRAVYDLRTVLLILGGLLIIGGILDLPNHSGISGDNTLNPTGYVLIIAGLCCLPVRWISLAAEQPSERATRRQGAARRAELRGAVIDPLARATMYSSDPQLARTSMIYTAQREVRRSQEMQAGQRELTARQRVLDAASEEQRMRFLARAMADEMVTRVEDHRRADR